MGQEIVAYQQDGGLGVITLNRPEARNGVTAQVLRALHETVRTAALSDARVVILRGAGSDFCVGADIRAALSGGDGERPRYEDLAYAYQVSAMCHQMPQGTIAAIDGGCAGAGLGWAAACDLRFAATRAVFATAFLKVGATGDMGTAWFLNRIVGPARARELMFIGRKFDAAEAERIGFVNGLFDADALHTDVEALAASIAAAPAATLRLMKANFVSAETLPLDQYIELETARHTHIAQGPALLEGFASFMAERNR